jgi:hypothetical protein
MDPTKSIILVVDDTQRFVDLHLMFLSVTDMNPIVAMTLDELFDQYNIHREELAGIILDGCLHSRDWPDTIPFIERVAADRLAGLFTGKMVAASLDPDYRQMMVEAGCDAQADKAAAVTELLALIT